MVRQRSIERKVTRERKVLGAFWYFLSIEREIACWHVACGKRIECIQSSFKCDDRLHILRNFTFLNDVCQIDPLDKSKTLFDFGMFLGALQSGVVQSKNFSEKFLHCFWWGLRNLRFAHIDSTIPYY
ncbi:cyclic nucleotide-gated ion channel 1 [Quercus suber]|uniref:Cyclic nucleotide-gated ion channel 1 n=1 Tax=Quercus suber TaxID=58331 RepID=A0AAW0JP55_QUESU